MFKFIVIALAVSCIFTAQTFSCDDGEYVDTEVTPNKCKSCPQYCTTCSSSSVCTSCSDRYFLYNNADCELKTIITAENCVNIADKDSPAVCSECADGYWLKEDNSCAAKELTTQCATWAKTATETCLTTNEGYSLVETNLINCTGIANCIACSSTSVCTTCKSTHYLGTDSLSCKEKTGNCLTWTVQDEEDCASCQTGYTKLPTDTKTCYATQCTNTNTNAVCGSGKARSSAPACNVSCNDANCLDCTDAAATTCLECADTYILKAGACVLKADGMPDNCIELVSAENDDNTKCSKCSTDYTLISDVCLENIANCNEMESAIVGCKTCEDGYYLNSDDPKTCTACGTNCKCSAADALCTSCLDTYFYDDSGDTANCATACSDSNCLECSATGTGKCTKCESGYGKEDAGTCTKCEDAHCTACGASGKTCTECPTGYYLDSTESAEEAICVECTTTNSKYINTNCNETSRVDFPWTCAALTGNCAENNLYPLIGEADQSCKACSPGYFLNDNACKTCISNCYECSDDSTCAECYYGYYLADSKCVICDTTCSKCSSSVCLDCKINYAFSADNALVCTTCLSNCQRCDVNTTCIKCSTGYYLEENNTCTVCSTNCADCSDANTCFSCSEGSYLDETSCKDCLENCKVCTSATLCTTCSTGYELNSDKNACTKSESSTVTGRECLESVSGCIKCDSTTPSICVLCSSGSLPADSKCTCDSGLLIGGECVVQETEDLPEDLSSTDLATLKTYVTKALASDDTKANNTLSILSRINTILSAENNDANAGTALQLLLQFADTTTETDAQTSYSAILTASCGLEALSESNYYIAFAAADKFMTTATDKKAIYELGFSTCLTNLLKNVESASSISPMTFTNSEFMMSKFTSADVNSTLELTGVSITVNDEFMATVGDGTFYATVQAIANTANPYASEQTNTDITLSSKIVSFSVMTSGSSAAAKTITLSDGSFPITFDTAGSSGKCSYYDTTNKKWVEDGELNDTICSFTHLTDFVILKDSSTTTSGDNAYMLQSFAILLVFFLALF